MRAWRGVGVDQYRVADNALEAVMESLAGVVDSASVISVHRNPLWLQIRLCHRAPKIQAPRERAFACKFRVSRRLAHCL
jgi:hypothetical protein